MSSQPNPERAVFLSYASQDAAAVTHIAETLRSAGIEVWFDQNELVGGDAWDAKIRKQIAECALFVPVISASTQARLEGYFRIEWKLAAQRTHAMAEEKAFLLPVVIDATRDAEAKVPGEFRAVQWTRLRPLGYGGQARISDAEALEKFCERVKSLLAGEAGPSGLAVGARLVRALPEDGRGRATPLQQKRSPLLLGGGAFAIVVAIGTALFVAKKSSPPTAAPAKPSADVSSVASAKEDDHAVAVLPFENLGGDKEQEYFSDGLTEEILNALARERDLRVPGRMSSFSFKGKNASPVEIATALNVSRLVEGSVQRFGSKVRIRVSLTRVADNASEELGTFTEEFADIFTLYDKVARAVVEKLTHRQLASSVEVLTKNSEAYNAYLKGRALQIISAGNGREAAKLYEQAVALDPGFALAWARLAEARFRPFRTQGDRSPEVVSTTRTAIDRALAVQPNLPEALIMRANWVRSVENDFAAARRDLDRAEALQPATAELRLAQLLLALDQDNWPEVDRLAKECLKLDPQNGDNTNAVGAYVYYTRGNFAEADRLFVRAQDIQGLAVAAPFNNRVALWMRWRGPEAALRLWDRAPPGQARSEALHAHLLLDLGRIDEARAAAEGIPAPSPVIALGADRSAGIGFTMLALGREDRARAWAEANRAEALKQLTRGNRAPVVRLRFVEAEIILGHRDSALAELKEWGTEMQRVPSVSRRMMEFSEFASSLYARLGMADETVALLREEAANGFLSEGFALRYDHNYALVRNDPRFQELMQQAEAWAKAQPDPVDP